MRNPLAMFARVSLGGFVGAIVGALAGLGLVVVAVLTCAAVSGGGGDDKTGYAVMGAMACVFVGVVAGGFTGVLLAARRRRRAAETSPAPPAPQPPPPKPTAQ
jgi:Na+/melibiose symporter-like transporter